MEENGFSKKKIGVLGAGAIGSVVGGFLQLDGHDVTLIDPWFEHIEEVRTKGLTIRSAHNNSEVVTQIKAVHFKDMSAIEDKFDMGFVAVNGYDTDWATVCLNPFVKEGGVVCCLQNGVNDHRIAKIVGQPRTLGLVMTISAAIYDAGIALRTDLNPHCFKVGELDGTVSPRATEFAAMLSSAIGPSAVTPNLWGQRWSKLVVNCMNNGLAGLTGWMTAECRTHHDTQRIGIQLAAEVVRVAKAKGLVVDGVMGLSPDAIVDAAEGRNVETARAQLAEMARVAGGGSRPSFGQDVLKGRRTEIMQLNGFVSQCGREVGVATPFCDTITEIVTTLGVGFKPTPDHIKPLIAMVEAVEAKIAASAAKVHTAQLTVATVGAGYFAQFHLEAWKRIEDVDLVAVCDHDADKLQEAATKHGVKKTFNNVAEMLTQMKPDIFDIITPPSTHYELVETACKHGVPTVICQKPLADNLQEAVAIVELAEKHGTRLVVHENFRWQPWHRELQRLLHSGIIGTCYNATFRLRPGDGVGRPPAYAMRQPYFLNMERFLIHETGIHLVDVFRFLFGEVRGVNAELGHLNSTAAGEDAATVVFNFGSGVDTGYAVKPPVSHAVKAVLDCNRLVDHDASNTRLTMGEMLIEGDAGALRLDGEGRIFVRSRGPGTEREHTYPWRPIGFGGDCVHACQAHVVSHLLHRTPLENTGRQFLKNVEVEEAIYQSDEMATRVTLPLGVPTVVAELALDDTRAELGEGPIWDARRSELLWVDILHAKVFSFNPKTGVNTEHDLSRHSRHVTTIVPCANHASATIVTTTEGLARFDLLTGEVVQHHSNGSLHSNFTRMNDGKADPQGRLWFGSVAKESWEPLAPTIKGGSSLYVLDRWEGAPTKVVPNVTIANGLAWTSDGKSMYWIDSGTLSVDRFDFDGNAAQPASNRKTAFVVSHSATGCFPDGCALDTAGMLWVAVYGAGEVRRFNPETGDVLAVVRLPRGSGVELTACAFGGDDLEDLYITTAAKSYSPEKRAENPLGGGLFRVPKTLLAKIGDGIRGVPMSEAKL